LRSLSKLSWSVQGNRVKAMYKEELWTEAYMYKIQHWCMENLPGSVRLSFDTYRFKTRADITAFLLKWS
jgi:hypothetical protein